MAQVKVTQVRSANRSDQRQKGALRSLRLGKIGRSATHEDNPSLRGLIRTVNHLVITEDAK